jgi:hypothetical protein
MNMVNYLRTLLARFIVRYLSRPRSLLVAVWGWLAPAMDDLDKKQQRSFWAKSSFRLLM